MLCEANRLSGEPLFRPALFEAGGSVVDGPPFCHLQYLIPAHYCSTPLHCCMLSYHSHTDWAETD